HGDKGINRAAFHTSFGLLRPATPACRQLAHAGKPSQEPPQCRPFLLAYEREAADEHCRPVIGNPVDESRAHPARERPAYEEDAPPARPPGPQREGELPGQGAVGGHVEEEEYDRSIRLERLELLLRRLEGRIEGVPVRHPAPPSADLELMEPGGE